MTAAEKAKKWYYDNIDRAKKARLEYRIKNHEHLAAKAKERYRLKRDEILRKEKERRRKNPLKYKKISAAYYKKNKKEIYNKQQSNPKIKTYRKTYYDKRMADPVRHKLTIEQKKEYEKRNKEMVAEIKREYVRKIVKNLDTKYIKGKLIQYGWPKEAITDKLIDWTRKLIFIKRKLKQNETD